MWITCKELVQSNEKEVNNRLEKRANGSSRQVTEKEIHMANTHMKRCSTLVIIKEMKSKPSMS